MYIQLAHSIWNTNLGVFKLLLNIFDDSLTVQADKGATDQLWVDRVCTDHLASDFE